MGRPLPCWVGLSIYSAVHSGVLVAAGADVQPAPMSALLIEKHKLRGPDGRNATVSVAAIG